MDQNNPPAKELALSEARRTIDNQVDAFESLREDIIDIIKINLLIGSVIVGVINISNVEAGSFTIVWSIGPLGLSTLICILGYGFLDPTTGLNPDGISDLSREDDGDIEIALSHAYATWIGENGKRLKRIRRIIISSLAFSTGTFVGILFLV